MPTIINSVTCPVCGSLCDDIEITVENNEVIKVKNGCAMCESKFLGYKGEHRVKTPLIRKNGELVETSWEEALSLVAEKLSSIKAESGPDSIAVLTSAKCTNEENYLLQKLARAVVGTNNVDHCARL